jgi:hypothetical protein
LRGVASGSFNERNVLLTSGAVRRLIFDREDGIHELLKLFGGVRDAQQSAFTYRASQASQRQRRHSRQMKHVELTPLLYGRPLAGGLL